MDEYCSLVNLAFSFRRESGNNSGLLGHSQLQSVDFLLPLSEEEQHNLDILRDVMNEQPEKRVDLGAFLRIITHHRQQQPQRRVGCGRGDEVEDIKDELKMVEVEYSGDPRWSYI